MAGARIEFVSAGFREILLSEGCRDIVQATADEICDKANANNSRGGDGFVVRTQVGGFGGGRWISFVDTTDKKSVTAETEDQALTRALT